MSFLRRHPFPVVAHFRKVVAVSFAFPKQFLQPLIPVGLEIDSHEGWGFATVAMVWTKALRPALFPSWLGQDFFLAGYRIFVRLPLPNDYGRSLRGLNIIRSETNKRRMVWSGNLLTSYHYRYTKVRITETGCDTRVLSHLSDGTPTLDLTFADQGKNREPELPEGSPFNDWRTARRFAGPMPFTFSKEADGSFLAIQGTRANWSPHPVCIKNWQVALFDEAPWRDAKPVLANAFMVENVAYRWEKGRRILPGVQR